MAERKLFELLVDYLGEVEDPRSDFGKRHQLLDIMVIAVCAVICGAENWREVEHFGQAKESWLRGFLELPHGIPSHWTFRRVFACLDPEEFERGFRGWVESFVELIRGQVVALDGKTLRRSHDGAHD